jgi:hypothetical protein
MEGSDLFAISPGHDSWVVGEEPYALLRLLGDDSSTLPAKEPADDPNARA